MACFKCAVLIPVVVYIFSANCNAAEDGAVAVTSSLLLLQNLTGNKPVDPSKIKKNQTEEVSKNAETDFFRKLINISFEDRKREVNSVEEFWKKRNALADSETEKLLGHDIVLTNKEILASQIILKEKIKEYNKALNPKEIFLPAISFFQAKDAIEKTTIFKIIRQLPKGAGLYNFLISCVPFDFVFSNLTYEENLYFRFDDTLRFIFSKTRPAPGWRLLSRLRNDIHSEFVEDLNAAIKDMLTLVVPNSRTNFGNVLQLYSNLTSYLPNFIKLFRKSLETLYEDNIMYAELNYNFPDVYDLDGIVYDPIEILQLCQSMTDDFIKTHPTFLGVRFLYVPIGDITLENLPQFREATVKLWKTNPKLISGFGILSLGESGPPWSAFVEEFLKFPKEIKFFLGAGATRNWGFNSDYTILDALALNTRALGAGIAISKHPLMIKQLRKKGVPIVVFPVASQSFGSAEIDQRMHPAALLVATDSPILLSNIGGTFFNDTGLSYDWYLAYMAMTPRFCDIRCLKQFSINSWLYSSLSEKDRKNSIQLWEIQWNKFIDYIIDTYH